MTEHYQATDTILSVDPRRCRLWPYHNRDPSKVDRETCDDLIKSIRDQGRQEVPAIARPIEDQDYDYEIVCGARRLYSVSWLQTHGSPEIEFRIQVRQVDDEGAFLVGDLENRYRPDLSPYDRSSSYQRALTDFFGGNQSSVARKLNVTPSWLSRYLDIAELPDEIVAAFGDPAAIKISHAARLTPAVGDTNQREALLAEAKRIANEQRRLADAGDQAMSPATVTETLLAAGAGRGAKPVEVKLAEGAIVGRVVANKLAITISTITHFPREEVTEMVHNTLRKLLERVGPFAADEVIADEAHRPEVSKRSRGRRPKLKPARHSESEATP